MKRILIHLNTYKNTDLIVNWILRKQFQSKFNLFGVDSPARSTSIPNLEIFLKSHPDLCAISTTCIHPSLLDSQYISTIFLKHPLDRVAGIYEADRRKLNAKQQSLQDYVEAEVNSKVNKFENAQFNFLDYGNDADPSGDTLSRAEIGMNRINVCGLMQLFNESLVVLETELSHFFPDIDLSFYPKRFTSNKFISLSDHLELLRSAIGSSLFDFLEKNNEFDIELIKLAETRLLQQLHAIPNWEEKLLDLERRCHSLR